MLSQENKDSFADKKLLFQGAQFSSYEELQDAIDAYTNFQNINLYKSDSRRLQSAWKRIQSEAAKLAFASSTPDKLVYHSLTLTCSNGFHRQYKHKTRTKGKLPLDSTENHCCKFEIKIALSSDLQNLEIVKMSDEVEHNHEIPKEPIAIPCKKLKNAGKSVKIEMDFDLSDIILAEEVAEDGEEVADDGEEVTDDGEEVAEETPEVVKEEVLTRSKVKREVKADKENHARGDKSDRQREVRHIESVTRTMLSFQQEGLFCDTAITTNEGMIFVHSAIVAAVCPNLQASLNQKPFNIYQPNILDLSQFGKDLVEKMVQFFYTGKLGPRDAVELAEICGVLGIALNLEEAHEERGFEIVRELIGKESWIGAGPESIIEPVVVKEEQVALPDYGGDSDPEYEEKNSARRSRRSKKKKMKRSKEVFKTLTDKPSNNSNFSCSFCDKVFWSQRSLCQHKWAHYKKENGYECNICLKMYKTTSSLRHHLVAHDPTKQTKTYVCSICEHGFNIRTLFQNHMNTHSDAKPHMCEFCGHCFNDKYYLSKHVRIHSNDRRFACSLCGKRFTLNGAYRAHLRAHKGQRPYQCEVCAKRFTRIQGLQEHKMRHTGEMPHRCDFCSRPFRTRKSLRSHKSRMHCEARRCLSCTGVLSEKRKTDYCVTCTRVRKNFEEIVEARVTE